jgi:hypothetical protein
VGKLRLTVIAAGPAFGCHRTYEWRAEQLFADPAISEYFFVIFRIAARSFAR